MFTHHGKFLSGAEFRKLVNPLIITIKITFTHFADA